MNATFNQKAFQVVGHADIVMKDGRRIRSQFPAAVWRWIQGKDWESVTVTDHRFDQSWGWDRF